MDVAPLCPELKLSRYRTQRCSSGTVVPPEVTQTILVEFWFSERKCTMVLGKTVESIDRNIK